MTITITDTITIVIVNAFINRECPTQPQLMLFLHASDLVYTDIQWQPVLLTEVDQLVW